MQRGQVQRADLQVTVIAVAALAVGVAISAYTIDATTGALAEIAGSPFAAEGGPFFVTVDPSGKFAYVASIGSDSVSAYAINAATGALSELTGSQYATGSSPTSIATARRIQ